jgi:SAM-dependent methyltransferase
VKCRHCQSELDILLADLRSSPPSNAYLSAAGLREPEKWYPLRVLLCPDCWLAQTEDYAGREELFSADYAYFSSFSSSWLDQCKAYASMMVERFALGAGSRVAEVAANDGYLLQFFRDKGIPCFGVEPTASTAAVARAKGIQIFEDFFGAQLGQHLAAEGYPADLIVANNVLAHVPDINDFVAGFGLLLKPGGVATFEFPHLYRLVTGLQFDTIYHEHFSYLSLMATARIFEANGLGVFDVEELPTHGGSLRVYAQRLDGSKHPVSERVRSMLALESSAGMDSAGFYAGFQHQVVGIKHQLLGFLLSARERGEMVVAYGAAAKGNTLLNFSGVRDDLLAYVMDKNPAKQGKFLPGSRIPIVAEDRLAVDRPPWILILPWNIRDEVAAQLDYARQWGARFVTAVPRLTTF